VIAPRQEFVKEMQDATAANAASATAPAPAPPAATPGAQTPPVQNPPAPKLDVASVYPAAQEHTPEPTPSPLDTPKPYDPRMDFSISVAKRAPGLQLFAIVALILTLAVPAYSIYLLVTNGILTNVSRFIIIIVAGSIIPIAAYSILLFTKRILVAKVVLALLGIFYLLSIARAVMSVSILDILIDLGLGMWLYGALQEVKSLPVIVKAPTDAAPGKTSRRRILIVSGIVGLVVLAAAITGVVLVKNKNSQQKANPPVVMAITHVSKAAADGYATLDVRSKTFSYSVIFDKNAKMHVIKNLPYIDGKDTKNGAPIEMFVSKPSFDQLNCIAEGQTQVVGEKRTESGTYNICYTPDKDLYGVNFEQYGKWYVAGVFSPSGGAPIDESTAVAIAKSITIKPAD
jgi:hypothetical protein